METPPPRVTHSGPLFRLQPVGGGAGSQQSFLTTHRHTHVHTQTHAQRHTYRHAETHVKKHMGVHCREACMQPPTRASQMEINAFSSILHGFQKTLKTWFAISLHLAPYVFCAHEKYFIDCCLDTVIFYLLEPSL